MSNAHDHLAPNEPISSSLNWEDFGAARKMSARFAEKLRAQELAEAQAKLQEAKHSSFEDGFAQGYAKGRSEGHAKGYEEGYAQGNAKATLEGQRQLNEYVQTQGQQAARDFAARFALAEAQLADSEQTIARGVLELACELARQVVRHELTSNPNALLPVIREALGILISDSKSALVRLHPLDLDMLQETLRQEFPGLQLSLLADSSVTRGGCLVESAGTVVDGTVEKRWSRAVARLGLESSWEVSDDGHG